jgi:hypothetical protein
MLQLVRGGWSIEGWHWICDTQWHEDAHRYRGNGSVVRPKLPTAVFNLFRQAGLCLVSTGLQAVMPVITPLLVMVRRKPALSPPQTLNQT